MTPMAPTVQVMPGPGKSFEAFQTDNTACKVFAADSVKGQAEASNQRAFGAALLTTALGAGVGAAGGDAATGAAVGAAGGSGIGAGISAADQQNIQAQYDNAFSQCMYAKGEQVPGFEPVPVAYSAAPVATPNPLVRATQAELIRLGYLHGAADGFSGPMTRSAIVNFESANGMPADGATSQHLLAKLQATSKGAATVTAAAPPSNWVAPTSGGATPVSASAPAAPSGWVAPTKAQ